MLESQKKSGAAPQLYSICFSLARLRTHGKKQLEQNKA